MQRLAGNRATTQLVIQRQRVRGRQPGTRRNTPFGQFVVVPDGQPLRSPRPDVQPIRRRELQAAEAAWRAITTDGGSLRVVEQEPMGGPTFPGFRLRVLNAVAGLLSRPRGRRLVLDLVASGHRVSIGPSRRVAILADGGEAASVDRPGSHTPGVGSDVVIGLDPEWRSVRVYDRSGNVLSDRDVIRVGHELIHARHAVAGTSAESLPATDAAYENREEEQTIDTGDLTENDLREEHRVDAAPGRPAPRRHGHGGSVSPFPASLPSLPSPHPRL